MPVSMALQMRLLLPSPLRCAVLLVDAHSLCPCTTSSPVVLGDEDVRIDLQPRCKKARSATLMQRLSFAEPLHAQAPPTHDVLGVEAHVGEEVSLYKEKEKLSVR